MYEVTKPQNKPKEPKTIFNFDDKIGDNIRFSSTVWWSKDKEKYNSMMFQNAVFIEGWQITDTIWDGGLPSNPTTVVSFFGDGIEPIIRITFDHEM